MLMILNLNKDNIYAVPKYFNLTLPEYDKLQILSNQ